MTPQQVLCKALPLVLPERTSGAAPLPSWSDIAPGAGLFKLAYQRVFKPLGVIRPAPKADDPKPHLFAQGVGALVLTLSIVSLYAGLPVLGWALTGIVVALAAINLFLGFCMGCFMYYQLARRGIHANLPWWQARQGA